MENIDFENKNFIASNLAQNQNVLFYGKSDNYFDLLKCSSFT